MFFKRKEFDTISSSNDRRCKECRTVLEAHENGLCDSCKTEADQNFGGVEAYDYDSRFSYGG